MDCRGKQPVLTDLKDMTVMATTARSKRTRAPQARTQTEVAVEITPKASIWTRIKTTAKRVVGATKRVVVIAAKTVAKPFKAAARKATFVVKSKSYRGAKTRVVRVAIVIKTFALRLWNRALRPILQGMMIFLLSVAVLVSATVAPISTVLTLAAAGILLLALSSSVKDLEQLELAGNRRAKITLRVLEVIAQIGRALAYLITVIDTVALAVAAPVFAIALAILVPIGYFAPRQADALPERSEMRLSKDVTPADAPNAPETWTRGNFLRAKGTEELWGTEHDTAPTQALVHADEDEGRAAADPNWAETWRNDKPCTACDSTVGAIRIATDGPVYTHGLCATCFDLQCEADALLFTGVSLNARSVEFRLTQVGLEHHPMFAASKFEPTSHRWLESAWYRDRTGRNHTREWCDLANGHVVARVVNDHKRHVWRASVLGKVVKHGVVRDANEAMRIAQDALSDEQNAVERTVTALEEVAAIKQKKA